MSELKALSDQQARWVPPVAKPPPPRIRCPSPQAIREIRAARIRRDEEGNPRFDATQHQQLEIRAAGLRREIKIDRTTPVTSPDYGLDLCLAMMELSEKR